MQNHMFMASIVINLSRIVSKDFLLIPTISTEMGMMFLELQDLGTSKKVRLGVNIRSTLTDPSEIIVETGVFDFGPKGHEHEDCALHIEQHSRISYILRNTLDHWPEMSADIVESVIRSVAKCGVLLG